MKIADSLGVIPDNRVKVIFCVEGPNDISFFQNISKLLHKSDNSILDLNDDPRVIMIPLGGSTLRQFVERNTLKELGRPEVHIYDRDNPPPSSPKYDDQVRKIYRKIDGSWAVSTEKKSIENYLHPDAVFNSLGIKINFGDWDDVPEMTAKILYEKTHGIGTWSSLNNKDEFISKAKRKLNNEAVAKMDDKLLKQSDPNGDIIGWLKKLSDDINK
jgi:hypothetical protein